MKKNLIFLSGLIFTLNGLAATKQEALLVHNQLRAQHHAPPLTWDNKLATYAENYAKKCHFQHSRSSYGENIAAGYPSISAAIHAWYAERAHYSRLSPEFSYRTGHFTQLVWQSTRKLGCGYAACNGKNGTPGNYLVCEYSPAGNITSRKYFQENVF